LSSLALVCGPLWCVGILILNKSLKINVGIGTMCCVSWFVFRDCSGCSCCLEVCEISTKGISLILECIYHWCRLGIIWFDFQVFWALPLFQ
jgi:hypothetical protein